MEPLTHTAIGLTVAKITGNPIIMSEPATMCIVAGSVFPDIDILLQKWGDITYLKNHRGVTHSIPGLLMSSLLIATTFSFIYANTNFITMFLWAFLGCCSHVFIDIFNTFGAKILWPLLEKKYSLNMLSSFDPIIIGLLLAYIFTGNNIDNLFLAAFLFYFASRGILRFIIIKDLCRKCGNRFERISILPSMKGLFKWHFILEGKNCNIIGEKDVLRNKTIFVKKLYKIKDANVNNVMLSAVGKFFCEFTPMFHITCEKIGDINRYVFIDMRYFIRNKFLHHAVLEIDKNNSVVKQTFNPYSMRRSNIISSV